MPDQRPNFLVVVADDLGFSDIAPYGGEIHTPNLARLAAEGLRMTNFHTASACSPTRSMLFSGTDHHIAGLGQMDEYMRAHRDRFRGRPGYEGYLNWRVAALSEVLQDAGYHTLMSGKWHLGFTRDLAPCARGFDKNFTFLPGSGNHYAYEPQLAPGQKHPPCMKTRDFWMEGDRFLDIERDLPRDFYSTTSFTDKLMGYLEERTPAEREQPFFAYLAFTAPHWPLQASREVMKKYEGMYDDGPNALTQRRLQRMKQLGLVDADVVPAPPTAAQAEKAWADMSADERKVSARKMEAYAAMVEIIDENVGRVLRHLEASGELDNTLVLFMSDNGAEGATLEAVPLMGGPETMGGIINKYYDNSLENIGNKDSFVWYGPRWACAATAPSRAFKCWITEGGIRCPCLVRYPPLVARPASISRAFTTVMDIMPTLLDLAGVPHPGPTFRNRPVVTPRGRSWRALLSAESDTVHGEDVHIHGWELFGQRAIRRGRWKAVWIPQPKGKDDWELYDVEADPAEVHDLCETEKGVLAQLIQDWEVYYAETGMMETPRFVT
ncbi:hypothetical protein VTK73DRAFT_7743 [Phialemonium thermophilum]|uniref:Sulfatase N-terminal domain-containing protein n=1 Tax=Phialemonium thermophilum TaxID=223376 RepID=A0ABR3WD00_9PEZI